MQWVRRAAVAGTVAVGVSAAVRYSQGRVTRGQAVAAVAVCGCAVGVWWLRRRYQRIAALGTTVQSIQRSLKQGDVRG